MFTGGSALTQPVAGSQTGIAQLSTGETLKMRVPAAGAVGRPGSMQLNGT